MKTTVVRADAAARLEYERNKQVTFIHCVPFTDCKSEMKNIQEDKAKDPNAVMSMYQLTKLIIIIV